jgi:hypothetical protein
MSDLVFIVIAIIFLAISLGLIAGCQRLLED